MTAEQILNMITTQRFADFYNSELEDYLTGEKQDTLTREKIIANLQELINFAK
jgi:hypothetical protein